MKLKKLTENVYYIKAKTNIGVIKDDNQAILIDSGLDDSIAKKILRILEENDLKLKAIINTHSHADHYGANAYLQKKTGAEVYAFRMESAVIKYPYLEPLTFFSGANPIGDLKNKFLMSEPSEVDYVIAEQEDKLIFDNLELEVVNLQGHSVNQIGIGVEGVLFCGDAIFSEELIKKHKLLYYMDIGKQKATLNFLKGSNYDIYISSHTREIDNIVEISDQNLAYINQIEAAILEILSSRKRTEEVFKELCDKYSLKLKGSQQYYLMKTVVMAYLSYLYEEDKLKNNIVDNYLYWELK
ncbi:MBL fold metallo-hydrolase [Orenia marismortui]|uniref:Glyoxylase-like metal-dependent hydrolase (Beta-lactamase superfamily II) n=1 Tax=Orenia marismortui TaxID=46469 RepID=A0A4R8GZQ0_9FIRM|nr:MBL fold metallo-hydrolase [Orenia marismortui]TDX52341.1 glyoxylase-like metal-dependent hydrolase (beta-lactamase superfamily II) [Orenia marismortui]